MPQKAGTEKLTRSCVRCGKFQWKKDANGVWRCGGCIAAATRRYQERKGREWAAEKARRYRAANPGLHHRYVVHCPCGKPLRGVRHGTSRKPLFCSDACRQEVIGRAATALMKARRA